MTASEFRTLNLTNPVTDVVDLWDPVRFVYTMLDGSSHCLTLTERLEVGEVIWSYERDKP